MNNANGTPCRGKSINTVMIIDANNIIHSMKILTYEIVEFYIKYQLIS